MPSGVTKPTHDAPATAPFTWSRTARRRLRVARPGRAQRLHLGKHAERIEPARNRAIQAIGEREGDALNVIEARLFSLLARDPRGAHGNHGNDDEAEDAGAEPDLEPDAHAVLHTPEIGAQTAEQRFWREH